MMTLYCVVQTIREHRVGERNVGDVWGPFSKREGKDSALEYAERMTEVHEGDDWSQFVVRPIEQPEVIPYSERVAA
jgi:hypothetical protein